MHNFLLADNIPEAAFKVPTFVFLSINIRKKLILDVPTKILAKLQAFYFRALYPLCTLHITNQIDAYFKFCKFYCIVMDRINFYLVLKS